MNLFVLSFGVLNVSLAASISKGSLGLQKDEIIEDLGNLFFLELQSRSLFERVPNSSKNSAEEFSMHDLVNDLAQIASSQLCIRLEENQESHMLERSRHASYSMVYGDFGKLEPLYRLEKLRTLLPICSIKLYDTFPLSKRVLHNIFPRLTSLRALSLSYYAIKKLPSDLFIKLKLLRFLDLSWTEIKQLPDSICVLYNLETLLLSSCRFLKELPQQMEKLINLRHLDISGSSRLMMPLHLSKLKNLHVLLGAKFLLGDPSGWRLEDLGELHNLYGSLSLLELENVADRRGALKANIRGKEHIEKLSLGWSVSIADSSQNERDILGELHPNPNIKELEINRYRGTDFPNWLADHSFSELVQLSLSNCVDCYSLPALGQLPSFKFLAILGMRRITEVTEEFYGSSSSKKPFNSLERLEFAEMLEWKQWHVLGNGELIGKLPENLCSLTKLTISNCPELNLETHIQLSSLKTFKVEGSPKVGVLFDHAELFLSQLQGMKQIVGLYITDCQSLTSLHFTSLPNTLKKIKIKRCGKLKLESSVGDMITIGSNLFVEKLELEECDSIDEISPELVPQARYLSVKSCHSLTRLSVTSLRTLDIYSCKKLKSFPEGGLPFNLEVLRITHCKKLVNGRKEWGLQRLPCLRELYIIHEGSDEEIPAGENWELPCSIRILLIENMKTLSSQVLKSLTSLESLYTYNLPQIQSLSEDGLPSSLLKLTLKSALPSSLSELHISICHNLRSIPESALPSSLSELNISICNNLQSIPVPSSLSKLTIWGCHNLHSTPESVLRSSLSELNIKECPKLQSLPVKGMPSSVSELSIYRCPLLKALLEFEKGKYWPNIAHIPTIRIDREHQQ